MPPPGNVLKRIETLEREMALIKKRTTFGGGGVPTGAHSTTHEAGSTDELDITTLGGFPNGSPAILFLREDGTFADPGSAADLVSGFGITVDGAGDPVTTGQKGYLQIPFGFEIEAWSLVADQAGDIQFDIWAVDAAKPVDGDSITGGNEPALSASDLAEAGSVSGWTTTLNAGDWIGFNLDSTDGVITRVTLQISGTRL